MNGTGDPSKLCMMVVSDTDADSLMGALVERGFPATKVGSTGGFLRRGNVTIFSGVTDARVDELVGVVTEICHARKEFVPVQTLPFLGDGSFNAEPVEVRVGGAIVFVLGIDSFHRI
ncbi:MAG: hypothetical protein GEU80_08305 [Dehalococcoidia bacterium]|nr:hypothetical protein [Dehalococcoidia bacterium]